MTIQKNGQFNEIKVQMFRILKVVLDTAECRLLLGGVGRRVWKKRVYYVSVVILLWVSRCVSISRVEPVFLLSSQTQQHNNITITIAV